MKKLVLTLTLAIATLLSFAQIPQTFSYQGVVRDADNKLVTDKQVMVSVQILQGTDDGTAVYSENHEVTTNANGLMTFELGSKDAENFAKIDWSNAPYFVKTVAEFDGKQISGVTPLLAVPYALYATKAESADVDLSDYYLKSDVDALLAEMNAKIEKLDKELHPIVGGAIVYAFSVSADKKVYFSQGNLQYQASTGTWRFADNQYDMIGDNNSNISSSYSGWIDMFGWGTSGYHSVYPYSNNNYAYAFEGEYTDIAGTNYDWGIYNKISNGGNQTGQWRTFTKDEWYYVINTRANASDKKGVANVNGVNGLILLPDEWILPDGIVFNSGFTYEYGDEYYATKNSYTMSEWSKMEANGAVFLPVAGYRNGTNVYHCDFLGNYWSSSAENDNHAYYQHIASSFENNSRDGDRYIGKSVRLVQDAE